MDSPRLDNRTDFVAEPHLLVGKEGERLCVIVKATFWHVRGESRLSLAPAAAQVGIRAVDIPWGDPEKSSLRYPSDLFLRKPCTDVIVVARACAPGDRAVPWFDAGVRAGKLEKTVRVFGLRVWEDGGAGLSAPLPTKGIEVRYDFAWGGADFSDPKRPAYEPRNPAGTGVVRDAAALTHRPAPLVEDPENPIRSIRTAPAPAGLGAIGRHWEPRRRHLGTYDAEWLDKRAPLLPLDHDDRANCCASPGLSASPPFSGGEGVALLNLTPGGGTVSFALPKIRVAIGLAYGGEVVVSTPPLDTVVLDTVDVPAAADARVELTYRADFPAPRRRKEAVIRITEEELP